MTAKKLCKRCKETEPRAGHTTCRLCHNEITIEARHRREEKINKNIELLELIQFVQMEVAMKIKTIKHADTKTQARMIESEIDKDLMDQSALINILLENNKVRFSL